MRSTVYQAALLLVGSGFCSLVYQVAWLRLLRLVFGASTAASAAVLAIFMGGLGIGGLLLGGRADRHRRPLALYGRLELGIAALAAVSPALVLLVRHLYIAAGGSAALGQGPGTALRLVLADTGAIEARPRIESLTADTPFEAGVCRARWSWRRGDGPEAAERLEAAFAIARRDPWLYPPVLSRALALAEGLAGEDPRLGARLAARLAEPFSVNLLDELRARTRLKIAATLGDPILCGEALAPFEPHVPWEGPFLLTRFQCYQAAQHPRTTTAQRDVQRFLDQAPPRLETGLMAPSGRP